MYLKLIQKFITTLTRTCHWNLSGAIWIHFGTSRRVYFKAIYYYFTFLQVFQSAPSPQPLNMLYVHLPSFHNISPILSVILSVVLNDGIKNYYDVNTNRREKRNAVPKNDIVFFYRIILVDPSGRPV